MKKDWSGVLITPETPIEKAIEIIDRSSQQIAVVVNPDRRLLGTVTDGDIRRGIMRGIALSNPVSEIMNSRPISIPALGDPKSILAIMQANKLRHLPVVDSSGIVIGLEKLDDLLGPDKKENWVVVMAGGLGTRLRPLTDTCPKAMLKIGGKPILETILEELIAQGFANFCFSVNYKSEHITGYFEDGAKWGVELDYLFEERPLGTAGSLSLFKKETDHPIIVMNGDILTKLNFDQLLTFHMSHGAGGTVAVTAYDFQVEYGVVKFDRDMLVGFEEKPVFAGFINAGIYALSPNVLRRIPDHTRFDMNQLLEEMLAENEKVCTFPIREYWLDVGKMKDFDRAELDYNEVFRDGV